MPGLNIKPGCDTAIVVRGGVTDSIVKQRNRHASSPLLFGRRGVRPRFPSPHSREGAERRKALGNRWHLCEGAACFAKHARLPALHLWRLQPRDRTSGTGPEGCPSRYPGGFRRPSPGPLQPLKAAPVVGRTVTRGVPERGLRNPGRRRHTLLRQPDATGRRPQLSKACRQYRVSGMDQE